MEKALLAIRSIAKPLLDGHIESLTFEYVYLVVGPVWAVKSLKKVKSGLGLPVQFRKKMKKRAVPELWSPKEVAYIYSLFFVFVLRCHDFTAPADLKVRI